MGTRAPCDPVTQTVYANEDQRGFEVDSWSRPTAKRNIQLWLFIWTRLRGSCGQSELSRRVKPMVTSLFCGYLCRVRFPYGNLFVAFSVGRLAVASVPIIATQITWITDPTDYGG
jgi:hypothetical protein